VAKEGGFTFCLHNIMPYKGFNKGPSNVLLRSGLWSSSLSVGGGMRMKEMLCYERVQIGSGANYEGVKGKAGGLGGRRQLRVFRAQQAQKFRGGMGKNPGNHAMGAGG